MADYGPLEPSNRLEWFLANGGGNGGSGGGEFTTAKLSVLAGSSVSGNVLVPCELPKNAPVTGSFYLADYRANEVVENTVILYSGTALLHLDGDDVIDSMEGAIEVVDSAAKVYAITGDAFIAITGEIM